MALSKQQRMAVIDFLVPLLNDEGKRQMHMDLLFAGEPRRPDLNLHGGPRETTTRIVLALETYQIERGKPALVDLLQQVSYDVGIDHQALIEEWQNALLMPVSAPASAQTQPPPPAASVTHSPPHDAKPSLSRAELFAMPGPFAWVSVPAGQVTLEAKNESYLKAETTFDLIAFGISKYPVTVGQFQKFVEADAYRQRDLWPQKGWKWMPNNRDQLFDGRVPGNYPALVTWYEAMAFCAWLSLMTDQRISLPSEHQWQRAAQGDDDRLYPWGNDWDAKRCNNQSPGLTPVNQYEGLGDSPYGVVDLIGNAAEWTLTNWTTGEQGGDGDTDRVIRGGSYENKHLNFLRATTRTKAYVTTKCAFRLMHLFE
jgi:formylglycine-generating enzyme required for sulfatase activity